jgi:uncharacterized protein YdbL (DUF1318 family)
MHEILNPARRAAFAAMLLSAAAAPAFAQDLTAAKAAVDAAKTRGEVGEQGDGYLGFVRGPGDAALKAAVDAINAGRADAFRDAAAKTGVSPAAAGQAAAQQLLGRMPAGQYYKPLDGSWTRK